MTMLLPRQKNVPPGPPYLSQTAILGGVPTVSLDVPVTAIFLFLFLCGAVFHFTVYKRNTTRQHKFLISGFIFAFCMARVVTCIMRIVWANFPKSARITIAAQVFIAAGVLLLYLININFAQRIVRAMHPHIGWHPVLSNAIIGVYVLVILTLVALIISVIQSLYTLDANTHRIDHDIQLYAGTLTTIVSFLPIPLVIGSLLLPRRMPAENFGSGRLRTKVIVLLTSATLLCSGAGFRMGTGYKPPRPQSDPPAYYSKACFYVFNFTVELVTVYLYMLLRVDMRFHVPDGSRKPGDYSRQFSEKFDMGNVQSPQDRPGSPRMEDDRQGKSHGTTANMLSGETLDDTAQTAPATKKGMETMTE